MMKRLLCGTIVLIMVLAMVTVPTPALAATNIGFKTTAVNNNSVSFIWDPVSNVQRWNYDTRQSDSWGVHYYIEESKSLNGEYFKVTGISFSTTYTDDRTSLVPGETYYYRISFMVGGEVYSSNTLTVTLPSVVITGFRAAMIDNNGVLFRWDAVTNVVGWDYITKRPGAYSYSGHRYYIERSETRNGEYTLVGSTNAELTYTDNSAGFFKGGTYYYRLSVMVNTTVISSEPIEVTLQSIIIPGFQILTKVQDNYTFIWDAVNNVQRWNYDTRQPDSWYSYYYVERSNTLNGEYFSIASTNQTTYTVNNATPGYYKVSCMVNGTIISSEIVRIVGYNPNIGAVMGNVLHSDVRVYIDDVEIAGYNINGRAFVIAEDLSPYGFKVTWNSQNRMLTIVKGVVSGTPKPVPQNTGKVGSVAFQYVYTDIVMLIDGKEVEGYNIGGQAVIFIDDLAAAYGSALWDATARTLKVTIR